MAQPKLYRKRFIPEETVYLKDDRIVYAAKDRIITEWKVLHPKANFSHGISCYYMEKGWKISKFLNEKDELVYYYCDMIETMYQEAENAYIFTDLLADVIIFPDGTVEVVDLGEIADAMEVGLITEGEVKTVLRNLDAFLQVIYGGGLMEMIRFMEKKVQG